MSELLPRSDFVLHLSEVAHPRRRRRIFVPYTAVGFVCALADLTAIVFAASVGYFGYQWVWSGAGAGANSDAFLQGALVAGILFISLSQWLGQYRLPALLSTRVTLRSVLFSWLVVCLLMTLLAFLLKSGAQYSRGSTIASALIAVGLLSCVRLMARSACSTALQSGSIRGRPTVVLGDRDELATLSPEMLLHKFGLMEVGRVQFPTGGKSSLNLSQNQCAAVDSVLSLAKVAGANELILSFAWADARLIELVRDRLRLSPLPVKLLPDRRVRSLVANTDARPDQVFAVELQRSPLSVEEIMCKRALDIAVASFAIMFLLPVLVLSALAIKLDSPGPVLFRQRRNGFNTKEFIIFKFRSMRVCEDGAEVRQATRNDQRVTRVGAFLRRTSIDELPQLFNVLLGNMSMVGPRPHALAHDDHYGSLLSEYAFRHHVKPGITGWAQVNGCRGETRKIEQMRARVNLDIWYINNWSLWLDIRILCATAFAVFKNEDVY